MAFIDLTRVVVPSPVPVVPVKPATALSSWAALPTAFKVVFIGMAIALASLSGLEAYDHWPQHSIIVPGPPAPPAPVAEPIRVIFVYESDDPMSRAQLAVLSSPKVRDYLTSHCLKDGGAPAWRFFDKDVDASKETTSWQTAWNSAKADTTPVPKVVIFNKAGMNVFPLPSDEAATLDLLKKYGGQ